MGASREGTKQEIIINSIVQSVRNLDKLTWSLFDKVPVSGNDLLEEAEYLSAKVQEYISEIRHQMTKKWNPDDQFRDAGTV